MKTPDEMLGEIDRQTRKLLEAIERSGNAIAVGEVRLFDVENIGWSLGRGERGMDLSCAICSYNTTGDIAAEAIVYSTDQVVFRDPAFAKAVHRAIPDLFDAVLEWFPDIVES